MATQEKVAQAKCCIAAIRESFFRLHSSLNPPSFAAYRFEAF
jgi:hypothetical protein